jgi:chromosome segregation ATPase
MFDFAKAFAREINEEYLMEGIGELVRTIPENEQYNLSDQRYIEQLENKLKKAEDEVQFYKQQIKLKDEQYRDARNDIERLNRIIEQLLPRQENKKDLASVG